MAARFASSSAVLRSALAAAAAHAGLSAASLLRSAVGPSQLPPATSDDDASPSLSPSQHGPRLQDMTVLSASLPWIDRLHGLVVGMYVDGGLRKCCAGPQRDVMVQIGEGVSYENPAFAFSGAGEVERAFRGRLCLHSQDDVETVLECVKVEASKDSICSTNGWGKSLLGNPPRGMTSNAPKVDVTYRLSQQYGKYFSVHSLLVVTVQVRRGSAEKVRNIAPGGKLVVPLATSGFTPRAASTVAAATSSGAVALALSEAASKIAGVTAQRRTSEKGLVPSSPGASCPLVAEVVRIEEQWNGVQLLGLAPFHWSRRLNGLAAGSVAYFLFN